MNVGAMFHELPHEHEPAHRVKIARSSLLTINAYIGNTKKNTLAKKTQRLLNFDVKM
jgi:hypothetical protein